MQHHSTQFTLFFAAAVCVVCAVFVAGSAVGLKDRQERNKVLDRQKKVLAVAGLMPEGESWEATKIDEVFANNIKPRIVRLSDGAYDERVDAGSFDQKRASADPATSMEAPKNAAKVVRVPNNALVYQLVRGEQVEKVILPVEGKGLWSTLYGYLAMNADGKTISGITFYQHAETPGLGGEVDNPRWKARWEGRKPFDERFQPVFQVKKGAAGSVAEDPHSVDGLSGATLTGRGVTYLIQFWLGEDGFGPYLARVRSEVAGG